MPGEDATALGAAAPVSQGERVGLTGEFTTDPCDASSPAPTGTDRPAEPAPGEAEPRAAGGQVDTRSPTRRSAPRANMVLAGLLLAGMGCVYLLSLRDGPAVADARQQAIELQIDSALQQFDGSPGRLGAPPARKAGTLDMIENLYARMSDRQVPVKHLRGNPFVFVPPNVPSGPQAPLARDNPVVAAIRRARNMKLQSVMLAEPGAAAVISDRILTVGQQIEGWIVSDIGSRQVVLTYSRNKDLTYVLKLSE